MMPQLHPAYRSHPLRRTAFVLYGGFLLAMLIMPREMQFWLDNFPPNPLTALAGALLAPFGVLNQWLGLRALHDLLQGGFQAFVDLGFG